MIRGPILEIQPDGTRLELTSPSGAPDTLPFGAAGTEVWVFDYLGQHVGSTKLVAPAYIEFPHDYEINAQGKLDLKHVEIPW